MWTYPSPGCGNTKGFFSFKLEKRRTEHICFSEYLKNNIRLAFRINTVKCQNDPNVLCHNDVLSVQHGYEFHDKISKKLR